MSINATPAITVLWQQDERPDSKQSSPVLAGANESSLDVDLTSDDSDNTSEAEVRWQSYAPAAAVRKELPCSIKRLSCVHVVLRCSAYAAESQ